MQVKRTAGLVINAPEFFQDPAFVAWLNNGRPKFTWHRSGSAPGEFSDLVVLVEPSLNGEGSDPDMPRHVWDAIIDSCRKHCAPSDLRMDSHLTVRLTNLGA